MRTKAISHISPIFIIPIILLYMSRKRVFTLLLLLGQSLCILEMDPYDCEEGYYNPLLLNCSLCPGSSRPSADRLTCVCPLNSVRSYPGETNHSFNCVGIVNKDCYSFPPYPEREFAAVADKVQFNSTTSLLECIVNTTVPYLNDNKEIDCRPCGQNEGIGEADGRKVCVPCPDPRQGKDSYGNCICPDGYISPIISQVTLTNVCIHSSSSAELSVSPDAQEADVFDENGALIGNCQSEYTNEHLATTAFRCRNNKNITACQHLANMCVMQLYGTVYSACRLYTEFLAEHERVSESKDENWRLNFPWIVYATSGSQLREDTQFTQRIAFNPKGSSAISRLDLWVAKFTVNGTFLGIDNLLPSFFLCPKATFEQVNDFSRIGANLKYDCDFDLRELIEGETIFYELFVMNSDNKLIDVPVYIQNPSSATNVEFVRRFYMYDNTGILNCIDEQRNFVRFARSIHLGITLQPSEKERIYRPVLEIKYDAKIVDLIAEGNNVASFTMTVRESVTVDEVQDGHQRFPGRRQVVPHHPQRPQLPHYDLQGVQLGEDKSLFSVPGNLPLNFRGITSLTLLSASSTSSSIRGLLSFCGTCLVFLPTGSSSTSLSVEPTCSSPKAGGGDLIETLT